MEHNFLTRSIFRNSLYMTCLSVLDCINWTKQDTVSVSVGPGSEEMLEDFCRVVEGLRLRNIIAIVKGDKDALHIEIDLLRSEHKA